MADQSGLQPNTLMLVHRPRRNSVDHDGSSTSPQSDESPPTEFSFPFTEIPPETLSTILTELGPADWLNLTCTFKNMLEPRRSAAYMLRKYVEMNVGSAEPRATSSIIKFEDTTRNPLSRTMGDTAYSRSTRIDLDDREDNEFHTLLYLKRKTQERNRQVADLHCLCCLKVAEAEGPATQLRASLDGAITKVFVDEFGDNWFWRIDWDNNPLLNCEVRSEVYSVETMQVRHRKNNSQYLISTDEAPPPQRGFELDRQYRSSDPKSTGSSANDIASTAHLHRYLGDISHMDDPLFLERRKRGTFDQLVSMAAGVLYEIGIASVLSQADIANFPHGHPAWMSKAAGRTAGASEMESKTEEQGTLSCIAVESLIPDKNIKDPEPHFGYTNYWTVTAEWSEEQIHTEFKTRAEEALEKFTDNTWQLSLDQAKELTRNLRFISQEDFNTMRASRIPRKWAAGTLNTLV